MQKFSTIEIFFYVTTDEKFAIEYNFHPIDAEIGKEIVKIHREGCEAELYDMEGNVVDENKLEKTKKLEYYSLELKSKDFNLYRNINLIFYFDEEDMEEAIIRNTGNV